MPRSKGTLWRALRPGGLQQAGLLLAGLLLTGLLGLAPACSTPPEPSDPVLLSLGADENHVEITFAELRRTFQGLFSPDEALELGPERGGREVRGLLIRLITEEVLLQEAERRGLVPSEGEIVAAWALQAEAIEGAMADAPPDDAQHQHGVDEELGPTSFVELLGVRYDEPEADYRWILERDLALTRVREVWGDELAAAQPLTEQEVEAALALAPRRQPEPEVETRQIVTADRATAESVLARLQAGEDFGPLAVSHSIAPEAAEGGALGWMPLSGLPPRIAEVLAPGGMPGQAPLGAGDRALVQTEFGVHVVELLGRRQAEPPTEEERRAALRSRLQEERSTRLLDEAVLGRVEALAPIALDEALDSVRCCIAGKLSYEAPR